MSRAPVSLAGRTAFAVLLCAGAASAQGAAQPPARAGAVAHPAPPAAAPPIAGGLAPAAFAPLSPCDIAFGSGECAPVPALVLKGASFAERFAGQTVSGAAGGLESLAGTPSAPLALAPSSAADGLSEYLGTLAGLGGGGCAAESLGEGVLACLFDAPQRLVRATPDFLDGGTGAAFAWSATGQLLASAAGAGQLVLAAPPGGPPIAGCSLVPLDPGGLAWRLSAEPWNLIDELDTQLALNAAAQHTLPYEGGLVLRRGAPEGFRLRVRFAAPFDPALLETRFVLEHDFDGATAAIALAPVAGAPDPAAWESALLSVSPDQLSAEYGLNLPVTAAVGRYVLRAELWLTACSESLLDGAAAGEPLTLVFNPWLAADGTHFPGAGQLEEHLLSEEALVARGDAGLALPRPWRLASFEAVTLAAALAGLTGQPSAVRAEPHLVARRLSAWVNAEGGGLIATDFDGPYAGGTSPFAWTGTDQVLASGTLPFAYAHDGAVAGVLTSLCRALGIPARPVSGYNAARDVDGNGALDLFVALDGHLDAAATVDRLWDVQTWTEARFRRPDIAAANGWQALQGTPLLLSGGEFRNGPASVAAIFGDQFSLPFDTAWWGPTVDADLRLWRANAAGGPQLVSQSGSFVANPILAKAMGEASLETITFAYKPGLLPPPGAPGDATLPETGVIVDFHPPLRADLGQSLDWSLALVNPTATPRTAQVVLEAFAAMPDGSLAGPVLAFDGPVALPAFTFTGAPLVLDPALLSAWTSRTHAFRLFASVDVLGSSDRFTAWARGFVTVPPLAMSATPAGALAPGGQALVTAGFVNPLPVALTQVRIVFSVGSGLALQGAPAGAHQLVVALPNVPPGGLAQASRAVVALAPGQQMLGAALESAQLANAVGFLHLDVSAVWSDLGSALAGAAGTASLSGTGPLTPGSSGQLELVQAKPSTAVKLFIGGGALAQPFKGGVFLPAPLLLTLIVTTDASGRLVVPWTSFPGLPAGAQLVFHAWWADPGGPLGLAASNALAATAP